MSEAEAHPARIPPALIDLLEGEALAVAISIVDPRNPYRYLAITGMVVSWSEQGWREHMDKLSRRYMKLDRYPWSFPGERRAIFRIVPTHVYFETGDAEITE